MQSGSTCAFSLLTSAFLSSWLSLKQRPQPVSDHRINIESCAAVAGRTKEEFSAPVPVDVHGIDELIFRDYVQVLIVRRLSKNFVQLAVNIFARHQCSRVLQ